MTLAGESLRRAWKHTAWGRLYRARMRMGLETCRWCGTRDHPTNPLTFDHIVPVSLGGRSGLDNLTILCRLCNDQKGMGLWSLDSLEDEERRAPAERQWARLVNKDVHRRRYACPICAGWWRADQGRRLVPHPGADGVDRCPGARRRVSDDSVEAVLAHALGDGEPAHLSSRWSEPDRPD